MPALWRVNPNLRGTNKLQIKIHLTRTAGGCFLAWPIPRSWLYLSASAAASSEENMSNFVVFLPQRNRFRPYFRRKQIPRWETYRMHVLRGDFGKRSLLPQKFDIREQNPVAITRNWKNEHLIWGAETQTSTYCNFWWLWATHANNPIETGFGRIVYFGLQKPIFGPPYLLYAEIML